ncbi:MAG: hypothetical protein ACRDRJ_44995 [Streptosporangiaceae bacterium]
MQTSAGGDLADAASLDQAQRPASGIARGAALIAGLTMLFRLLGLARTLVFSRTVGASCLGTAYVTANQVPNLVYELVPGGALTTRWSWPGRPGGPTPIPRNGPGSARSPRRC